MRYLISTRLSALLHEGVDGRDAVGFLERDEAAIERVRRTGAAFSVSVCGLMMSLPRVRLDSDVIDEIVGRPCC